MSAKRLQSGWLADRQCIADCLALCLFCCLDRNVTILRSGLLYGYLADIRFINILLTGLFYDYIANWFALCLSCWLPRFMHTLLTGLLYEILWLSWWPTNFMEILRDVFLWLSCWQIYDFSWLADFWQPCWLACLVTLLLTNFTNVLLNDLLCKYLADWFLWPSCLLATLLSGRFMTTVKAKKKKG